MSEQILSVYQDQQLREVASFDEDGEFIRELEELEGGAGHRSPEQGLRPHNGDAPTTEATGSLSPEATLYPCFLADGMDLEVLAYSYLESAVNLFCYTFFTGWDEDDQACRYMGRFERVVEHLGEEMRREIIDRVDRRMMAERGDSWQVFKYTCNEGFWSNPADLRAVLRVVESISAEISAAEAEAYSPEFLRTIQAIRDASKIGKLQTDWLKAGF